MSVVVVTKSSPVVVRPSTSEPAGGHISLPSMDECYTSLPVTSLLAFDQPIHDPVETVKRALSQALVHYGPIAGRLADGDRIISCTGEGVSFVGASASCPLLPTTTMPPMSDLTLQYPAEMCGDGEPLLLMQVTEFSCGGFTVAVTWNHVVADGKGMAQFLQAVGELARGMHAPSVLPARKGVSLPVIPASEVAMVKSLMKLTTKDMVALDVTVPWSLIKAEYGCTVFEAVAAVIWQCRVRAIMSDPQAAAPLYFPCNLRKHLDTEDGYYGNCFTTAMVPATAGSVANGEIPDLVDLIRSAKEKVVLPRHREGEEVLVPATTIDEIKSLLYNATVVGSWRNLGFDTTDFGHGTPWRVMWHMEQALSGPSCVACPPCKEKDGVNVMSLCVKPHHVDAFLGELASL